MSLNSAFGGEKKSTNARIKPSFISVWQQTSEINQEKKLSEQLKVVWPFSYLRRDNVFTW